MKYIYQARSMEGKIKTGTVEASSKEAAALLLQKYDVFVTSIKEQNPSILKMNFSIFSHVSKKDLAIFSRQLSVMLQSRVPVVQSLKSLAGQTKNPVFKDKIVKISQLVEEGHSLSKAFGEYPEIFNDFYVSLLRTGEASGKISESLQYISDHLEREYDIISQIRGAMMYPMFVIVVLVVVIFIIMTFVMPRLIELLEQLGSELPFFTSLMINSYRFMSNYGWIVFGAIAIFIGFLSYYLVKKGGRSRLDRGLLVLPIFGQLFKKIYLIRFAENLSTLISAGLSINNALKITKDTLSNYVYKEIITEVESGVSEGQKISFILTRYPKFFPPFVIQMIQVGEDTGKLNSNLKEIVIFYNKDINRTLATLTTLLEPILIIVLGSIVALLAVSIIEPLYGSLDAI